MASIGQNIDVNSIPERDSYDPVPPGTYHVGISKADVKPSTKDANNEMIVVEFVVKNGPDEGRLLWTRLNHKNSNSKAQEIAWKEIGELCRALGMSAISDTDQLVGRELFIEVIVEPAKGEYGPSNRIKKYHPLAGGASATASAAPAAAAPALPWNR